MPVYEFSCEKCGEKAERIRSIKDESDEPCPACKDPKMTRLISLSSFQLKGGTWAKDGYSSSKPGSK